MMCLLHNLTATWRCEKMAAATDVACSVSPQPMVIGHVNVIERMCATLCSVALDKSPASPPQAPWPLDANQVRYSYARNAAKHLVWIQQLHLSRAERRCNSNDLHSCSRTKGHAGHAGKSGASEHKAAFLWQTFGSLFANMQGPPGGPAWHAPAFWAALTPAAASSTTTHC